MGKGMKLDYLTLCSIAAQKAGTSYGKYMAMHGYHPQIKSDREDVESPQGTPKICPNCGKMFYDSTTKRKVYCSFDCQRTFCDRQAAQRYRDRKAAEKAAASNGG